MNTKLMTTVGCLLLAAAAIAPAVLGHSERAPLTGSLSGYATGNSAGVSGRYVGAAGPAIAIEAYVNPQDTLSSGAILYDAEVVVDGNLPVNEQDIDGFGTANGNTGQQPNLVDDGGQGGAGHTNSYTTTQFNTPGCQAGAQVSGSTHAGTDIWVGASCNWKEDQGGTSSDTTLVLCLTNALLAFNPLDPLLVEIQRFVDCLDAFLDCATDPTCGATGATEICGSDGTSDAIDYGYAGVGATLQAANFPAATGIVNTPPGVTGPCAPGDEAASIFVFDTVATNGGVLTDPDGPTGPLPEFYYPPNTVPVPEVYLALSGELWS